MISQQTAFDIAFIYREIEVAEKLLGEISEALSRRQIPDIRDGFGRPQQGLELGIPVGENSRRMFKVDWSLSKPVIEAHILNLRGQLGALNAKARVELGMEATPHA